jgi:hypothetical protein
MSICLFPIKQTDRIPLHLLIPGVYFFRMQALCDLSYFIDACFSFFGGFSLIPHSTGYRQGLLRPLTLQR